MIPSLLLSVILALQTPLNTEGPAAAQADSWPGFRGAGTSHSLGEDLPVSWSEDENLAWTLPLTGQGQSSPVVVGDRVFVTSIRGAKKEHCIIACVSLASGELLWQRTFAASHRQELSDMVTQAAPTPAADTARVYALFESGDIFALDHQGNLLWQRALVSDYGEFEGNHGVGSSPVLVDDQLVVLLDHAGPSYLLALDVATGNNRWKRDRSPRVSWTTPVVHRRAQRNQLVISSNGTVDGINPSNGKLLWSLEGITGNTIPSPTAWGDRILVAASKGTGCRLLHRESPAGPPVIKWEAQGARPSGFGSPLVLGDRVYLINKSGSLFALDLESGEVAAEAEVAGGCWASPLAAQGLIYAFGKDGTTLVLRPGSTDIETVAENELECSSTVYGVAVASGSILIRETSRLRCLRLAAK